MREWYAGEFEKILLPDIDDILLKVGPNDSIELELDIINKDDLDDILDASNLSVRAVHQLTELPYRGHGGREFDLMMRGIKPLTVFSYVEKGSECERFLQAYFHAEVARRRFVHEIFSEDQTIEANVSLKTMFALPSEAWRFEAYKIIFDAAKITGWNDALEFIEGSLLGYTKKQNDYWRLFRAERGLRWGVLSFYRLISPSELEALEKNGMKAFGTCSDESLTFYSPDRTRSEYDTVCLLTETPGYLIKFFINFRFVQGFSIDTLENKGLRLGVFSLPSNNIAYLNAKISGALELVADQ